MGPNGFTNFDDVTTSDGVVLRANTATENAQFQGYPNHLFSVGEPSWFLSGISPVKPGNALGFYVRAIPTNSEATTAEMNSWLSANPSAPPPDAIAPIYADPARAGENDTDYRKGRKERTSWIGIGDAFLVIDRNGDGTVSGGDELSFTQDKAGAVSDLDGLRAFDSNRDGVLSALDERWSSFGAWTDRNANGRVDKG